MELCKKLHILMFTLWICLCIGLPAQAQLATDLETKDDKGFLTALLEDSLGGEGRIVQIHGFEGALSRTAKITQITVADEMGIWLSLTDVLLEWNRTALLRGRLDIEHLSAVEVSLIRPPKTPESDIPAAEASGFALPNLPVAVQIKDLTIQRILLGEAILGDPAEMTLQANTSLEDGSAAVQLQATRVDDHKGQFIVDASYDAQTQNIIMNLELSEAKNGLIGQALNLEGRPELRLTAIGEGSLDDLVTTVALDTDGIARMNGQVVLKGTTNADRDFNIDLNGDMSTLVPQEYRRFFGTQTILKATARRNTSGAFVLSDMNLETGALSLQGALALNTLSWPTRIALDGKVGVPGNVPIVLPFGDGNIRLNGATLQISYDESVSEKLTAQIDLNNLMTPTGTAQAVQLNAVGAFADTIEAAKVVRADITFDAEGLEFSDPSLQQAAGKQVVGTVKIDYSGGDTLDLKRLNLSGSDYGLVGSLAITGLNNGFKTKIDAQLRADDLTRFSSIAQTDLTGRAELNIAGFADLGGAFDLKIDGTTNSLTVGIPQADAALSGRTTLELQVVRDTSGTRLPQLDIRNAQLQLTGSTDLKTDASKAQFDMTIANSTVIDPNLKGPIRLNGTTIQDNTGWLVDAAAFGPFDAKTSLKGRVTGVDPSVLFDVTIPNINQITPQFLGMSRLTGRANQVAGNWQIETGLSGPYGLDATLSGSLTGTNPSLRYAIKLPNIEPLGAQINGAVAVEGTAIQQDQGWRINTNLTGLSGTRAQLSGLVHNNGTLDLSTTGTVPLALANPFITPRNIQGQATFDLTLNGQPDFSSVAGTLTTTGARLSNPNLQIALRDIAVRADLNRGRAVLDASATVSSGGQVTIRGPISDIAGANSADLTIGLNSVKLVDPTLYKTTLDGTLNMRGPLSGGALISGQIDVGETNIQIPSSQSSGFAIIPQITHINTSAATHQTLKRARLTTTPETSASSSSGSSYGLNVTINAPARIYVRGRGLDAELGGSLSLRGQTDQVISSGRFNLVRGRLDILTKRFELDEGSIVLQGELDPYLRFVASTTTTVGTASIVLEGNASQPTVQFLSSPDSPEEEVLAQIFFGRDVSQLSAFQALQLASAIATLAGKGGEGIVTKLRRGFGLDDLDISTDDEGNTGLKLGKYITDNVYTDVTIGETNDAGASINIDLTPNLTVRGQLKSDGDSSIGLVFEKDY
jgi:translocation and assembly module TamB